MSVNALSNHILINQNFEPIREEPFKADYPQEIQARLEAEKARCCVVRFFVAIGKFFADLFHKLIGLAIVPGQWAPKTMINNDDLVLQGGKEVTFETADGVMLNGMHLPANRENREGKTIILFNGNGMLYSFYDSNYIQQLQDEGWNLFLFDYRGVGCSEGRATCEGLSLDGDAALQYVKSLGVENEKILLHGHSLGGAVASQVAVWNDGVNYFNDRSFSNLPCGVNHFFKSGCFGAFASWVVKGSGWEMDAEANWEKISGRKFARFSPQDEVIPEEARFHKNLPISPADLEEFEESPLFRLYRHAGNVYLQSPNPHVDQQLTPWYREKLQEIAAGQSAQLAG